MRKFFLIGTFIISLFIACCNKENIPDNGSIKGKKITVSAYISNVVQSKLSYTDDETNKALTFDWSDGEKFMMYRDTNSNGKEFTKENGNNNFSGENPDPKGKGNYYAVYGSNISNASGVLTVDIANQIGTNAENGINSFMVASSPKIDNGSNLSFDHKLTILKLELAFPAGTIGIVKEVIVTGLHNKADYVLSAGEYKYNTENKKDIKVTNGTEGFTIKNNKIIVYISVFPEFVAEKSVTIKVAVGNDKYAYTMTNEKTLKTGTVIPANVNLVRMFQLSDYYQWDAYAPCGSGGSAWGTGSEVYNPIDSGVATQSCANAPTYDQIQMYLGAGVYWVEDGHAYKLPNGEIYCSGLMVKKKAHIPDFDNGKAKKAEGVKTKTNFSSLSQSMKDQYFFLPACAGYQYDGFFGDTGSYGYYWLSIPTDNISRAFILLFDGYYAYIEGFDRNYGIVPMPCL